MMFSRFASFLLHLSAYSCKGAKFVKFFLICAYYTAFVVATPCNLAAIQEIDFFISSSFSMPERTDDKWLFPL